MMIVGQHHIGIAVENLDAALAVYRDQLGLELDHIESVPDQKLRVAMIPLGDETIELLEPTDDESPVAKFLAKKGEGFHHLALEVRDLDAMLEQLKTRGVRLIDEEPREGAGGTRIAFLHPKAGRGVLLELVENPS